MLQYTPYAEKAAKERERLLDKYRGVSAVEAAASRSIEKKSRRSQLEYQQQQEQRLEPVKYLSRREARINFTSKREIAEARKLGHIVTPEGKIIKRGYWEKKRKVIRRTAKFTHTGSSVGTFSQKELEHWGGPGSSWGTSSWQTKGLSRTGSAGWNRPKTTGRRIQDTKAGTGAPSSALSSMSRDFKADIAARALKPILSPVFRAMKPSEAKPHTTGTIAGRAFRSIGRSGLGRAAGSSAARTAFSGVGMLAGRIHPGVGLGLSIAKGIGKVYREA